MAGHDRRAPDHPRHPLRRFGNAALAALAHGTAQAAAEPHPRSDDAAADRAAHRRQRPFRAGDDRRERGACGHDREPARRGRRGPGHARAGADRAQHRAGDRLGRLRGAAGRADAGDAQRPCDRRRRGVPPLDRRGRPAGGGRLARHLRDNTRFTRYRLWLYLHRRRDRTRGAQGGELRREARPNDRRRLCGGGMLRLERRHLPVPRRCLHRRA